MEKIVEQFIEENKEDEIGVSQLALEVRHDLNVTKALAKRRTTFMVIMGVLSLLIIVVALAGAVGFLEFTPGVFTLVIIHLSWMFIVSDLLRGVHLDTMRARLKYPELYTADGRYYKRILSHELVMREAENSVNLDTPEE